MACESATLCDKSDNKTLNSCEYNKYVSSPSSPIRLFCRWKHHIVVRQRLFPNVFFVLKNAHSDELPHEVVYCFCANHPFLLCIVEFRDFKIALEKRCHTLKVTTAAQHHVPAGDAGHLPEAQAGSGPRPPYASFPGGHGDILCGRYFRKSAQLVHKRQKVLRGGHQKTAQRHHASCVSGGKHTGTKRMIQNLSGLTRNPNSIQYERSPAASAAGVLSPRQKLTPEKISAYFVNFCRQTGGAIL